jgi:peroxidase
VRVNEQPNLVVLHTVFMREHNRMVDILARLNPGWPAERLFQEARRITVAQYQHVVYKEWLPTIIGNNFMRLFGLLPLAAGHSKDYQAMFPTGRNFGRRHKIVGIKKYLRSNFL